MTNPMLAELDEVVPGELDASAPSVIWLQLDTDGDNDRRDESWAGRDGVTWCDESIGGLEIQYVRADLYRDMAKRLEALQSLAAAMYQAAGAYDMPVRFLDVLSAAGNGEPITEEQVDALLPCGTPDTLQRLEAAERDAYMAGYVQGCNDQACVGLNQYELREDAMRAADHAGYAIDATQEGEG